MWSIFDTLILISGIIVAVIAVLPIANIRASTRLASALIGGALILGALLLGSIRSFRYPSFVYIGPVLALLSLGAVVADARRRGRPIESLQFDDQANGVDVSPSRPDHNPGVPVAEPPGQAGLEPEVAVVPWAGVVPAEDGARLAAWAELHDAGTPAFRLAEILGDHPEFGQVALNHTNSYPELRAWIEESALPGDPT
ncbi:MAG: hypothetical protein ACOH1Y_00160 [Propionicimonas sp.]